MGDFKRGGGKRFNGPGERFAKRGGFGGGDRGGRGGFGGDRDSRGPVTMHQAICSKCGKPCEVPFKPSGDKPVFCNDCFVKKDGGGRDRGRDSRGQERFGGNRNNFKPSFKPEFKSNTGGSGNDELKRQIENLNSKMDKLIRIMEGFPNTKPVIAEKKTKAETKKSPITKTKKVTKKTSKK